MSQPRQTTSQTASSADKRDAVEESATEKKVYLSPERTTSSDDEDDITPCYIRGYN